MLLERHLIYQLVDFYLGDEAPQARMHGQQPRKKMGDKFSQPVLTHMAETLSALVRGCHTRTTMHAYQNGGVNGNIHSIMPPTSLGDQLMFMPNEDLPMVYLPVLYVKALKEGIHQKSITEIILHLCWEDAGILPSLIYFSRRLLSTLLQISVTRSSISSARPSTRSTTMGLSHTSTSSHRCSHSQTLNRPTALMRPWQPI